MTIFAVLKDRRRVPVLLSLGLLLAAGPLRAESAAEVSFPTATVEPAETFADPLLAEAAGDLAAERWADARGKAERVLKANKRSAQAWAVLGRGFYGEGLYRKAVRRFKKALKYDAHYAAAYYWKAKAFEGLGRLDEAANEYQAAFHADPRMETARSAWRRIRDQVSATSDE